uniref:Uncharacterized protein n=1 Tax=Hyaloperonospora arabidopsidis (strain Emoy2) TaxID=559515 RepID=M4C028_HYAAE
MLKNAVLSLNTTILLAFFYFHIYNGKLFINLVTLWLGHYSNVCDWLKSIEGKYDYISKCWTLTSKG